MSARGWDAPQLGESGESVACDYCAGSGERWEGHVCAVCRGSGEIWRALEPAELEPAEDEEATDGAA